jgi:hypothetical protein
MYLQDRLNDFIGCEFAGAKLNEADTDLTLYFYGREDGVQQEVTITIEIPDYDYYMLGLGL